MEDEELVSHKKSSIPSDPEHDDEHVLSSASPVPVSQPASVHPLRKQRQFTPPMYVRLLLAVLLVFIALAGGYDVLRAVHPSSVHPLSTPPPSVHASTAF